MENKYQRNLRTNNIRVRKLFIASRQHGVAIIDVNNFMGISEYTVNSFSFLITMIGVPTTFFGVYVAGEKKVTQRLLIAYILTIALLICSSWIFYLNGVISIPNVIPD